MSNDIRTALEPCPFCGSEASLEDERLLWVVRCSGCGACVLGDRAPEPEQELPESYWEPFRQSAVDRWNRRPAVPPAPVDLSTLLTPAGAYEPGTGEEDGAQLVTGPHGDNPQWWAPMYGCDTLDHLLDRIRVRILPHLRQPIAGIDVPGTDGDYGGLQELCDAEGVDVRIGAPLLKRAREAWSRSPMS